MMFDSTGYSGKVFAVEGIREVTRTVLEEAFVFTDYDLTDGLRLRHNDGTLLLLEKASEFEYDDSFHHELNTGESIHHEDYEENLHEYWRVNDVKDSFSAETLFISDKNGDGTVEAEEIVRGNIEYWDYWRKEEESGRLYFVIIEMDKDTGFFTVWDGFETHENLIQAGK
jgi:hypothetical protein